MFLKIADIKGESHEKAHKDEIEILSFSFGISQQGGMGYGGGGGAGKANFEDLSFHKRVDKASPVLFLACATGKHIDEAVLVVRKAGGEQEEYLKVTMRECLVSSVHEAGNEGAIVLESVRFNFTECVFQYRTQGAKGTLEAPVIGGYNVKEQRKIG
jgi:type VI secretion system secreted protein Hcp